MDLSIGIFIGILIYLIIRFVLSGFYVVQQNERAVKTAFGKAERLEGATTLDIPDFAQSLRDDEKERYRFPQLKVIPPGGPYFKMPWEKIHKVSVATQLIDIAFDPESPSVNDNNTISFPFHNRTDRASPDTDRLPAVKAWGKKIA